MNDFESLTEIVATYQRHGWELKRILATRELQSQLAGGIAENVEVVESDLDALWFSRPSHHGREAWELRLIAEQPYALFEAFEAQQTDDERKDCRTEMENRMRKYLAR